MGWPLSVVGRKGKVRPDRIFTESRLPIVAEIDHLADSGYQGLAKLQVNSCTPIKKTWNQPLAGEAGKFNPELAGGRIPIQHVDRRGRIFRLVKGNRLGKRSKLGLDMEYIITAIVNLRY
ncbi:hypothetical protein CMK12_00740 [Candidatus Poribacteria bacterium]|nr:hypothetical protein [Candidatus Poribacteria bacterium]